MTNDEAIRTVSAMAEKTNRIILQFKVVRKQVSVDWIGTMPTY